MLKDKGECVEEEISAGGVDVQASRMCHKVCARAWAIIDFPAVYSHSSHTGMVSCAD